MLRQFALSGLGEGKILFEKILFFVGYKQRPTEARLWPYKK
jgi:hypothetical protein